MPNPRIQISLDDRFTRLVVEGTIRRGIKNALQYVCKCDCGAQVYATAHKLVNGYARSCGCHRQETRTKHGISHRRPK